MKLCFTCGVNPAPDYQSYCTNCHTLRRRARNRGKPRSEKQRARRIANKALARGHLIRQPCEVCNAPAVMHHDDYSKPLDVRWLCVAHHYQHHDQLPPAQNGIQTSPLTES